MKKRYDHLKGFTKSNRIFKIYFFFSIPHEKRRPKNKNNFVCAERILLFNSLKQLFNSMFTLSL